MAFKNAKIHEQDTQVIGKAGKIMHFHCTANVALRDEKGAAIRIRDYDPKANIYLLTAYAGTEVERNARNAGAKGTISKDADWNRTAEKVVKILESS